MTPAVTKKNLNSHTITYLNVSKKNDHKYKNWRFHKSRVCQCLTNYQNNNFASFMKKYNIINVYPLSNCLFFSAYSKFLKLYRYVSSGYAWYRQTHVNVRQSYIIKYDECSKNNGKFINLWSFHWSLSFKVLILGLDKLG